MHSLVSGYVCSVFAYNFLTTGRTMLRMYMGVGHDKGGTEFSEEQVCYQVESPRGRTGLWTDLE